MKKEPKRIQETSKLLKKDSIYSLDDAIKLAKLSATAKFKESVDVAIQLGVDSKKSDQTVRGAIVLPSGTGKKVRVAVFAQGEKADQAKSEGADIVGMEDLADQIKSGNIDFDVLIASPDTMRLVGALGQILGPRGLMPNPKVGTVTQDVVQAVKNAKAGQVQFRTDKSGIVHCSIGLASFDASDLKENLVAIVGALNKAKPTAAKGIYLQKVALSSTMGPGIKVEPQSLLAV
jgi:large subunit ribosomal protein L1